MACLYWNGGCAGRFQTCNYLTERDTDAVYPLRAKAAMTKRENDIELQCSNSTWGGFDFDYRCITTFRIEYGRSLLN